MKNFFLTFIILLLFLRDAFSNDIDHKRIAHAGGAIQKETYSNSLDALNINKDKFNLFEIDFMFTLDGHLVCIHDWNISALKNFGKNFNTKRPTLDEFIRELNNSKFENCTLETLIQWLKQNPTKKIVTDIKKNNIQGLTIIKKKYPDMLDRFIPQIYSPSEYQKVKKLGYQNIIFTLYVYLAKYNKNTLPQLIKQMDLFAITIPEHHAKKGLASFLKQKIKGAYIYAHTINSYQTYMDSRGRNVDEIYTDTLRAF